MRSYRFAGWNFLSLDHSKLKKCHQSLKIKSLTSTPHQLILVKLTQRTNNHSRQGTTKKAVTVVADSENDALSLVSSCWMVSGEPGKLLLDLLVRKLNGIKLQIRWGLWNYSFTKVFAHPWDVLIAASPGRVAFQYRVVHFKIPQWVTGRGIRKSKERLRRLKLWSPFILQVDVERNGAVYVAFQSYWHIENMTDNNYPLWRPINQRFCRNLQLLDNIK